MKIFYNTSTGNSLYVAKKIKNEFENCELISIPNITNQENIKIDDEIVGFIYPIHYGGVPIIVYDFLSKVKINPNAYVFAIGVSGGGKADTSFYQVNKLIGKDIDNHTTIKYISNYTRAGKNPTEQRAKTAIEKYESTIAEFIESIKNREIKRRKFTGGLSNVMYMIFKEKMKNRDKKFNVNDECVGCKMCEKVCPVNNITIVNNKPKWNGQCVDCMACINICPKKAINIGKSTISKNRYINPYIRREELI